jgi:hypothetical protein
MLDKFTRQAKGQIKAANPGRMRAQSRSKSVQTWQAL